MTHLLPQTSPSVEVWEEKAGASPAVCLGNGTLQRRDSIPGNVSMFSTSAHGREWLIQAFHVSVGTDYFLTRSSQTNPCAVGVGCQLLGSCYWRWYLPMAQSGRAAVASLQNEDAFGLKQRGSVKWCLTTQPGQTSKDTCSWGRSWKKQLILIEGCCCNLLLLTGSSTVLRSLVICYVEAGKSPKKTSGT